MTQYHRACFGRCFTYIFRSNHVGYIFENGEIFSTSRTYIWNNFGQFGENRQQGYFPQYVRIIWNLILRGRERPVEFNSLRKEGKSD